MGKEFSGEKVSRKLFVKRGSVLLVSLSTVAAVGGKAQAADKLPKVVAPRVPSVPSVPPLPTVRVNGTSFLRCNFGSHQRDEIGISGEAHRSEAASFKGAIVNEDRTDDVGSVN